MPNTTKIDVEKFTSFEMPMIGNKPISDFENYQQFADYAEERGVDPKFKIKRIFRQYAARFITTPNTIMRANFEDFIPWFNMRMAFVDRSGKPEGYFCLLKEVTEDARAKYSFSDEAYKEYLQNKGEGYYADFMKGKMEKVIEKPVVEAYNIKEKPVVKAYNLNNPEKPAEEIKAEVKPVDKVQPVAADKAEVLFGDDESELGDVAEPAVEPVKVEKAAEDDGQSLRKTYIDIFEKMLADTKKGDSFFRGSSNEYKNIQAALRRQIKELTDHAVPDFTAMKQNIASITDMALKYVEKRSTYLGQDSYKGRRVGIMSNIANELLSNEKINWVTKDDEAVKAEPAKDERLEELQKVKANLKAVGSIKVKETVIRKPVVKAYTLEKAECRSKESFEKSMNDAIAAMRGFMKQQGLHKRHADMKEDIYFHFPMPDAVEYGIRDGWTRTEAFFNNFKKIEKYMRDYGCNKIVNTFIKAFDGMDKKQMMKSGDYADTIAKGVKAMRECVSGMTDKEYEMQIFKNLQQPGVIR